MNEKVKRMYHLLDKAVDLIRTSSESYKSFLSFASGIYKYGFSDSLLMYVHKPDAAACASLELWNKLGRRIRAGSKGIPLIEDSTENVRIRYVYDVKDTQGEDNTLPKVWILRPEHQRAIYDHLEKALNLKLLPQLMKMICRRVLQNFSQNTHTGNLKRTIRIWMKKASRIL